MNCGNFYESGLSVEVYDIVFNADFTQQLGDAEFYASYAKTGDFIIELGTGTGRIAFALAEKGLRILGVENSDAMLTVANAKHKSKLDYNVRFLKADMKKFLSNELATLILIPFRSFEMLLSVEDQITCLKNARNQLKNSGKLIIHISYPIHEQCLPGLQKPDESWQNEILHPMTKNKIVMFAKSIKNDVVNQISTEIWQFEEYSCENKVLRLETRRLLWRWTYPVEMKHLLALCGFKVLEHYSDFNRNPLRYGGQQIIVAEKI